MRLRNQPKALSLLATLIVCLMVVGAVACEFHPVSSEHDHEQEAPLGHHQDGHSDGVSCLSAMLPETLMLVQFTFGSRVAWPIRLYATSLVIPLFKPPQ